MKIDNIIIDLDKKENEEIKDFILRIRSVYREELIKEIERMKRPKASLNKDMFKRDNYFYNLAISEILDFLAPKK